MHTIVVFTRRSRHEAVLGARLADAAARGEKVLARTPGEHAPLLNRSLPAASLDPSGVVGSGRVEMLDTARWRAASGGKPERLDQLCLAQVGGRVGTVVSSTRRPASRHGTSGRMRRPGRWTATTGEPNGTVLIGRGRI